MPSLYLCPYPVRPMTEEQQHAWEDTMAGGIEVVAYQSSAFVYALHLSALPIIQRLTEWVAHHPTAARKVELR